jgi:alkylation response protein AidB-like acyl-CoA dehydrogenase
VWGADTATHLLVPGPPGDGGPRIVPLDAPGVLVAAGADGVAAGFASVQIDDAVDGVVLAGATSAAMGAATDLARLCLGSALTGLSRWILDASIAYARDRVQFGRPIGSFQAIQHKLAEMRLFIDQSEGLVRRGGVLLDERNRRASRYAEQALASSVVTARRLSYEGHQIFAGTGFMREHPLHVYTILAAVWSTLMVPDIGGLPGSDDRDAPNASPTTATAETMT